MHGHWQLDFMYRSFMRDKLKPVVKTEEQFLFVCHLVGPFFQRFHIERTRCMLDVSCTIKYTLLHMK